MKDFANNLICMICKKILCDPVNLSCNCTVCKVHLDDLCKTKRGSFLLTCPACNEEFHVPKQGFKINKLSKVIIDKDEHLIDIEKELKTILSNVLNDFEKLVKKLKKKEREFSLFQFDHYAEIKRNIDLRRELLKIKIDEISHRLIDQVNISERAFKEKIKEIQKTQYKESDVQIEKQILVEIFRNPTLSIESVSKLKLKQDDKINELKASLKKYEEMKEELKNYKFYHDLDFKTSLFGFLKLNDNYNNLVTCGEDDVGLNIWDINKTHRVRSLPEKVSCLKVFQKNKALTGSYDGRIKTWDLETGVCLNDFEAHNCLVCSLIFLSDDRIASGSGDETIKVWNLENKMLCLTLTGHTDWIRCLEKSINNRLISGSDDCTIKIWCLLDGSCIKTLNGHTDWIYCLKFLPNGNLISGSKDKTIKIWCAENFENIQKLSEHSKSVRDLELTSDGRLISCSSDLTIKIWDLATGSCEKTLKGHTGEITSLKINKDDQLISASLDKSIRIWDIRSGECLQTLTEEYEIWEIDLCSL